MLLSRRHAAPLAYISGSLGTLIASIFAPSESLSSLAPHCWDRNRWLVPALKRRNELLHAVGDAGCGWPRAWLIIGEPSAAWREWWARTLKPERILVIDTAAAECVARIAGDADRQPRRRETEAAIARWFADYRPRGGDELVAG